MKYFKFIFVSIVLLLLVSQAGQAQVTARSISLSTTTPLTCDTVKFNANWDIWCKVYSFTGFSYSISGSVITISVNYTYSGICIGQQSATTGVASLTGIPTGTYTVVFQGVLNGTASRSVNMSGNLIVGKCCPVTAEIAGDTASYCLGDTIKLKSTSTNSTKDRWFVNGVIKDSLTNFSYISSISGNDTVTLVTDTTTCSDTVSTSFRIMPNPKLINDTSVCLNDFIFINAPAGWHKYKWSTGRTSTLISSRATGTYTLTVTAHSGCQKTDSVTVTHIGPMLSLGPDTFFCKGSTVNIGVGSIWKSVRWNYDANDTNRIKTVDSAGVYIAEVTNSIGCKFTDAIKVTTGDTALEVFGSDTVCEGKSIKLYVKSGNSNLVWSIGSTTDTITVTTPGGFPVTAKGNNGCTLKGKGYAGFHSLPTVNLGNDTSICYTDTMTLNAGNSSRTYLWHDGTKLNSFFVDTSGTYFVRVEDANTCLGFDTIVISSIDCDTIEVKDTTISVLFLNSQETVGIYPNPAQDFLVIEDLGNSKISSVTLIDLNGRIVSRLNLQSSTKEIIDISNISAGTYLISLRLEDGIEVRKKILIE